jgi:hypothetical protein
MDTSDAIVHVNGLITAAATALRETVAGKDSHGAISTDQLDLIKLFFFTNFLSLSRQNGRREID